MSIYGIDVSAYQPINFALTTPGDSKTVDFAIIKATEGTGYVNPRFTGQRQWARDHGLAVGYYHFGRAGNMIAQADYFLSRVSLAPGESLWFDWEDSGISGAQKDQWIRYVQSQRPGFRCGLYCNTSFWKTRDTTSFAGDGLWIATGGYAAGSPPIESPWLIHQYSTAGGYDHDLAKFSSRADMISWGKGEEEDVAITDAEIDKIAAAVTKAVFGTDGFLESPADAPDHETNPYWVYESFVKDTNTKVRAAAGTLADILAQARANGASLSAANAKLDAAAAILADVDLSGLPEAIASKLEGLKFVLQEGV